MPGCISVVIVGIDGWREYTQPLLEQILVYHEPRRFEPEMVMVVVDNASAQPYPESVLYRRVRFEQRVSYAAAMNAGMRAAPDSDVYLILNNDVVCEGIFARQALAQAWDTIGGNTLNRHYERVWIDGWLYVIPRLVWLKVGEFDERFQAAAFEDADWCFRAQANGFRVAQSELPFRHLWTHQRHGALEFWERRRANFEYLVQKHGLEGWQLW